MDAMTKIKSYDVDGILSVVNSRKADLETLKAKMEEEKIQNNITLSEMETQLINLTITGDVSQIQATKEQMNRFKQKIEAMEKANQEDITRITHAINILTKQYHNKLIEKSLLDADQITKKAYDLTTKTEKLISQVYANLDEIVHLVRQRRSLINNTHVITRDSRLLELINNSHISYNELDFANAPKRIAIYLQHKPSELFAAFDENTVYQLDRPYATGEIPGEVVI